MGEKHRSPCAMLADIPFVTAGTDIYIYIYIRIENKPGFDHIYYLPGTRCIVVNHNGFAQMLSRCLVETPEGYMAVPKRFKTWLDFYLLLGVNAETAFNTFLFLLTGTT